MWLTKEAVRLAVPGHAEAVACDGCPPLSRLFKQYEAGGGQLLVCPICFQARRLDDTAMTTKVRSLFKVLVADAAKEGYSEYRTHLSDMDDVALTFDFNNHALLRLNETVKDALDPNGILAPGKQGIWPKAFRGVRA